MPKPRVFISFDVDNDSDAKTMLAGQAKHEDSPFDFKDASVKDHASIGLVVAEDLGALNAIVNAVGRLGKSTAPIGKRNSPRC